MRKYYSRAAQVERKKNVKNTIVFLFLTVALMIFLAYLGLPLLARFAGFIIDFKNSGSTIGIDDKTPPAPPLVSSLPEETNKREIEVSGNTEEGADVVIFFNATTKELIADANGYFSTDFALKDGENTVYAVAVDTAGNQSGESSYFTVTYDDKPPELTVSEPENGKTFYGEKQRQVTIKGKAEEEAEVKVNQRTAVVVNGEYSLSVRLEEGENTFEVVARDKAGNETKQEVKVSYSP